MLKDITLGQYYPTNSIIHRLDPRVKILYVIIYISTLFLSNKLIYLIPPAIFFILLSYISKIPLKHTIKGVKTIIPLILISSVFNIFLTSGTVLFSYGVFNITKEGIHLAIFMSIRLFLLIIASSLMTFTTTPNELTDGIEKGGSFLKIIKIPIHDIAMIMSIALRFIPILVDETDKIKKAQMARGADFESGGIIKRAKALIPLLVPLFISSFKRATDLAMAMDARCYNGAKRTRMYPLRHTKKDYIAYIILLSYLGFMITFKIMITR